MIGKRRTKSLTYLQVRRKKVVLYTVETTSNESVETNKVINGTSDFWQKCEILGD